VQCVLRCDLAAVISVRVTRTGLPCTALCVHPIQACTSLYTMIPVENEHVNLLQDPLDGVFDLTHVSQVISASDSIFREMCGELNDDNPHHIQACFLKNKKGVTRDKLIKWLETVCYILDSFSVPLLQNACDVIDAKTERIDELQREKIGDQQTIIKLQEEVIKKNSDELKEVKSTVQTEMKSYSSAVQRTCSTALSAKKIATAVKNVTDKDDRRKNLIIYGLEETSGEVLNDRAEQVLAEIDEKPLIRDCVRVGMKRPDSKHPRPVKLSLSNSDHVAQVLRNANKLHTKKGYGSIYIRPDRTEEERKAYKELLELLKQKRKSEPNRTHYIRYNRIVSSETNSESVNDTTANG